jgi:hypothetical protein
MSAEDYFPSGCESCGMSDEYSDAFDGGYSGRGPSDYPDKNIVYMEIIKETPKAYLVRVQYEGITWIPKSQVVSHDEDKKLLIIKGWLFYKLDYKKEPNIDLRKMIK